MADGSLVLWTGRSGRKYAYYAYPLGQSLCAAPGNFIYARLSDRGQWEPLYIGESDDLAATTVADTILAAAREKGGTHVHAHLTLGNREGRFDEQDDLRARFQPEGSDQGEEAPSEDRVKAPPLAVTTA
jgi:hypothetical protein